MASNQHLIEKAAMMVADLNTGGLMNPKQFAKFYRNILDQPTIVKDARTVLMTPDSMKIEKIGFDSRVLRPGVEATALAQNQLAVPKTSTVWLNAKEVIAEVNISYDTLENNIELGGLYDTIMYQLVERVALDIEDLIINGDTASADPFLAVIDGIRKKAVSHIVNWQSAPVSKNLFKGLRGVVPSKYVRNPTDWKYYVSHSNELEWKDSVVARQTSLGDTTLQGGLPNAYGIPVQGIAMLQPYSDGATPAVDVNDALLVHPKNILLGISRNVRVEVDRDIRARKFIMVVTMKLDVQYEEEDAIAKAINISNGLT